MDPATHQPGQAGQASAPAGYFERLRTPWWWYLAGVGVSVLLGLEFAVAVSGWIAWVPFAILLPVSLLLVWRLSSGSVSVAGTTMRAGERTVPVTGIEKAIPLTAAELRLLVGRHSDPLAFTYIRSWVGPGVQLVLRAPAAPSPERFPEPYWLVSSRHPDRLVAAVIRATRP